MIPLAVPNLTGREALYLQECVDSTFVSSVGPFVDRLEMQVAEAAGTGGAVAVSTGTAGLHLALRVVGVGPGDLVALPSLTFVASANAIAYCGAEPWLFDVDVDSLTLDPEQLAETLQRRLRPGPDGPVDKRTGRRLAALLPVHTLGHPADMSALRAIGREHGVPVVADAAAALGATYHGRPIGEAGATLSVLSFNGNKTVTAGGGGAVIGDDSELLSRVRHLSTTARTGAGYDHDEVGYNYRMTNVQAAVGCAQMERLDEFVTTKRRIQAHYADQLQDLPGVRPLPEAGWARSACWFAGVILAEHDGQEVTDVRARLRDEGIDARPFWKPMHLQRPYREVVREPQDRADWLWPRVLTLPCSTGITDEELASVVKALRRSLRP